MKTKYHQDNFIPRLKELARRCGIELRDPDIFSDGTISLQVKNENAQDENMGYCGKYGHAFSQALSGVRWRTGQARYGFNTFPLYHESGWCYASAADIVHALDRLEIQE